MVNITIIHGKHADELRQTCWRVTVNTVYIPARHAGRISIYPWITDYLC